MSKALLEIDITTINLLFTKMIYHFEINYLSKFGSQGQQNLFNCTKIIQVEFVKTSGEKPILLFDDIFDKLVKLEWQRLLKWSTTTDLVNFSFQTHPERTENIVKSTHQSYKICLVTILGIPTFTQISIIKS